MQTVKSNKNKLFTTYRRQILDELLLKHQHLMKGRVIDIGGRKKGRRGSFTPPMLQVHSWEYVNIDKNTDPDFLCNAEDIPVESETFDVALLCELLEHVENPEKVLKETQRILKKGGALILSIPFLYPIHADPEDYQRWTSTKLRLILKSLGFSDIIIIPMGGIGAVLHDIIQIAIVNKTKNRFLLKISLILLRLTRSMFRLIDILLDTKHIITTGYFVTAIKSSK